MQQIEFLNRLDADARDRLRERLQESTHQRDELVIAQNDASLDVFFVLQGTARAQGLSDEGKLVSYREIQEGAMFGELSAIDGRPRSADVVAVGALTVGRLSQMDFRDLMDTDSSIRWTFLAYLTEQSRIMTSRIFEFSTMVMRDRLIGELLRMAEGAEPVNGRVEIAPAPTHFELASRISTHREAVSREMSSLSKRNLVTKQLKTLVIHDLDALRTLHDDKNGSN
ncbi:MAG: Crp/Fnr family transcriptional regulator [Pseudomonadota bacterium]